MKLEKIINKKNAYPLLLLLASAALLTVIQPPFGLSFLAWFAFVPFILACRPQEKTARLLFFSFIVGLLYWLGNLYWIQPVTTIGWLAAGFYLAALWPLLAAAFQFCRTKNIPLILAAPILITGAERLQGFFLGGFFWRYLAHSQFANLPIIQIADIFGAAGVSFIIALVNGLLAEIFICIQNKKFVKSLLYKTFITVALLTSTILYGHWRLSQAEISTHPGPLVAALQSNIPQYVKDSGSPDLDRQIFDNLLADSNEIARAHADLVIWPETMVPAILDERTLQILADQSSHKFFDSRLRQFAKNNSFLLVGAKGGRPEAKDDTVHLAESYNSAFLYQPDGLQSTHQYNKIHLVPFGEFVPFKKTFPPFYRLLMMFTPYDSDYSLDAGNEYTVFKIKDKAGHVYYFSVMICFEDTVPQIARKFTAAHAGSKQINWLVNITNDGWFVKFSPDSSSAPRPSSELAQHLAACVFRSVENRLACLRSANTGISCLIDPSGRIKNGFLTGKMPKNALDRQGIAGWFLDKMPIDNRVTLFSKYGQWLDFLCAVGFVAALAAALLPRRIFRMVAAETEQKKEK